MPNLSTILSTVSTADLEQILAERKRKEELEAVPKPVINPDWSGVVQLVTTAVDEMVQRQRAYLDDDDLAHFIEEGVLKTIYGPGFYDWYNKRAKIITKR